MNPVKDPSELAIWLAPKDGNYRLQNKCALIVCAEGKDKVGEKLFIDILQTQVLPVHLFHSTHFHVHTSAQNWVAIYTHIQDTKAKI